MNSLSRQRILNSKTFRWVGIIAILGLVLSACAPSGNGTGTPGASGTQGASGTETPGVSTTGTAAGTTSTTETPATSGSTTGTPAATTASTTAATTAPTTAATTAATSAATSAATATVGSGGVSGTPSGLAVNETKTNAQVYVLTDDKGMTLYWFLKDTANTSTCDAQCLSQWTPFLASGTGSSSSSSGQVQVTVPQGSGLNASDFGTAQTTDNRTIVTYRGFPLYYFTGDKNPGDTNGYGVAGLWTLVVVPGPNNATPGAGTATPTP